MLAGFFRNRCKLDPHADRWYLSPPAWKPTGKRTAAYHALTPMRQSHSALLGTLTISLLIWLVIAAVSLLKWLLSAAF